MRDTVNNVDVPLLRLDLRRSAIYGLTWICPTPLTNEIRGLIDLGNERMVSYIKQDRKGGGILTVVVDNNLKIEQNYRVCSCFIS